MSTPLFYQHGAPSGGIQVFPLNQYNCDSSGANVTCIYCGLGVKIDTREKLYGA